MSVFTLTFIRHGETAANKERIIQGQRDTDLSENGCQQAQCLGVRLQHEKFTHIFSSDLKRASQTCEIILKRNKASACPLVTDIRLRERSYGEFEGHSVTEYYKQFKKRNMAPNWRPDGGESILDLRNRASQFFKELCCQVMEEQKQSEEMRGGSLKRLRHTETSSCPDVFPLSPGDTTPASLTLSNMTAKTVISSKQAIVIAASDPNANNCDTTLEAESDTRPGQELAEEDLIPTTYKEKRSHASSGSTSSTSGCESMATGSSCEQLTEQTLSNARVKRSAKSSTTSLDSSGSSEEDDSPGDANTNCILNPVNDLEIHSAIPAQTGQQYFGCPNVSLSPVFEHRVGSLSSVSSGRSSSFDEGDSGLPAHTEVLIVCHGGIIREFINHFSETYGCKIPGGKKHAMQVSPNTGLSKFTVSMSANGELPKITCLTVHDMDHLLNADISVQNKADGV